MVLGRRIDGFKWTVFWLAVFGLAVLDWLFLYAVFGVAVLNLAVIGWKEPSLA